MSLLITGIAVWCGVHLFPAALPAQRKALSARLGEKGYRGIFSLVVLTALLCIVFGWRHAQPTVFYTPPFAPHPAISVLILAGLFLFFASKTQGNVKRFIRHPQMTGVILWGVAHLLTNGDSRSVALFGAFAVWAGLEILLINRREGAWRKPGPAAIRQDLIPLVIGVTVFALVAVFHARLFGVPAIPV